MVDYASCSQKCLIAAGTVWTAVGGLVVVLFFLILRVKFIPNYRMQLQGREIRQGVEAGKVTGEEEAGETRRVLQRHHTLENADLEDLSRVQLIGDEIAAMAILSSVYRSISSRRRYLNRKIICNTVVEVSRHHKDLEISAVFAGSTQEGLGDTLQQIQYFQASKEIKHLGDIEQGRCDEYAKRPVFSSDLDVMIVPLAICVGPNADLDYEHVQSKPLSFVKLKPAARGKLGALRECLTESGYLSAKAVKKLLQGALERAKYVYCGPSLAVAVEEHGAAVEMKWAEPSVNGDFFETVVIADFTFALRMPDWPRCALCWTERVRNWPSQHLAAAVAAGGCHAVAFYRDSSDDECQWRLSFSRAELILINALPPYARDMCIALKALFKSRIQSRCTTLSSYHLKTVFLWIVEQAPSKIFSSRDGTAVALVKSLALLNDYVRDGLLPHYFVSGHNILPVMSQWEVNEATYAIADAEFYTNLHLTRLRTSEAKYVHANDYLLVQLPGDTLESESTVQCVIKRQLNKILTAIPDAFEEVPITIPKRPVLVHLLTGRVVKLSHDDIIRETCSREYCEILTAVEQENVNSVKDTGHRLTVEANFKKAFDRELRNGLVYDTERSLANSRRYASKVEEYRTAIKWLVVVIVALLCGVGGGSGVSLYFCTCSDASSSTDLSLTDSSDSSSSNTYNDGAQNSYDEHGLVTHIALVGAIRGGTRILADVNVRPPSNSNRLKNIRG